MRKRAAILFSFGFFSAIVSGFGELRAMDLIALNGKAAVNPLPRAYILPDPTRKLTLADVRSRRFTPLRAKRTHLGFARGIFWVAFRVRNASPRRRWALEISYPYIDYVDAYFQDESGKYIKKRAGDLLPFREREFAHHNLVFPLPRRTGESMLYLRYDTAGSVPLEMRLVPRERLRRDTTAEHLLFGAYFGLLGFGILLYAFMGLFMAERLAFYFVWHAAFYGISQAGLAGLASQFLFPGRPELANVSIPLATALSLIGGAWFTRAFLKTARHAPILDRFLSGLAAAGWVSCLSFFVFGYAFSVRFTTVLMLFFAAALLAAGVRTLMRGYAPARLFLAGWSMLLLGTMLFNLFVAGLLPDVPAAVARYAGTVGSGVQTVFLVFAVIHRMHDLRREKDRALEKNLRVERRRAALHRRMSMRLEKRVHARTNELREANSELTRRDKIVRKELKMARAIQEGLLPGPELRLKGMRGAAYSNYLTGVGGDYFDVFHFSDGRMGILMADVCGHGIPAALVTVMAKINFMDITALHSTPERILRVANTALARSNPGQSYLTAVFLCVDENYNVSYCGAGHPDPLVLRANTGAVTSWNANGSILGILTENEVKFTEREDKLAPGDRILLYTDGIIEARAEDGKEFGTRRLVRLLRETANHPLPHARDEIIRVFEEFMGNTPREDDISLLLLEADPACEPINPARRA